MPDEKISALPAVTTVATGDLGVAVATGVTSKITQQNLINALVAFITANVNIGSGKIQLKTDGSVSLANGLFTVDAAGNVNINTTDITLNANGSGQFANGQLIINNVGIITDYGGIPTAGLGLAAIVASVALNGIVTTVGPMSLTDVTGLYRISGYLEVTQVDIAGTIDVSITFNDDNGPQTIDLSGTQILTATGSYPCSGPNPGSNIFYFTGGGQINLTVTVAGSTASSSSNLGLVLEKLQ